MMNLDKLRQSIPQNWRNWKTWMPLTLAVALGLVAAKVAHDLTRVRPVAAAAPVVERTPVVFAARDVAAGNKLAEADLSGRAVEVASAPAGKFGNAADLVGRVVRVPLFAGQAVVEGQLAPAGTGAGLQARIPAGMRAVTVEVDEFRGVAGFLVPGCFVDVVTTLDAQGGAGTSEPDVARTVVQNLEVLAVGRMTPEPIVAADGPPMGEAPRSTDAARSVTLLASPEQAEAVELACRKGQPRLVLRSSGDGEVSERDGVTVAQLRGGLDHAAGDSAFADAREPHDDRGEVAATPVADFAPVAAVPALAVRSERLVEFIRRGVAESTPVPLRSATPPVAHATDADEAADLPAVMVDVPTEPLFPH